MIEITARQVGRAIASEWCCHCRGGKGRFHPSNGSTLRVMVGSTAQEGEEDGKVGWS